MERARRLGAGLLAALMVIGLGACGSGGGSAAGPTTSSRSRSTTTSTAAPVPGRATEWREDTAHWKQLASTAFAEPPHQVADDLAALYRGGETSEVGEVKVADVRTGEPLVIVLTESGVSDAILGREIEITLEGGDEGWKVSSARVRDLCLQVDESSPTECG